MIDTVTFYIPVGKHTIKRLSETQYSRWPAYPLLKGAPFVAFLDKDRAIEDANASNKLGEPHLDPDLKTEHLARFSIKQSYVDQIDRHIHIVRRFGKTDLLLPYDKFEEFNDNIVGKIEIEEIINY